jgi:hypothetical protein
MSDDATAQRLGILDIWPSDQVEERLIG